MPISGTTINICLSDPSWQSSSAVFCSCRLLSRQLRDVIPSATIRLVASPLMDYWRRPSLRILSTHTSGCTLGDIRLISMKSEVRQVEWCPTSIVVQFYTVSIKYRVSVYFNQIHNLHHNRKNSIVWSHGFCVHFFPQTIFVKIEWKQNPWLETMKDLI